MKKMKHIEKDAEKMAGGIVYYFTLAAIFLILFFAACYLLNGIIDPNVGLIESLAENAIRVAVAGVKIGVVLILFVAAYKVFIESDDDKLDSN